MSTTEEQQERKCTFTLLDDGSESGKSEVRKTGTYRRGKSHKVDPNGEVLRDEKGKAIIQWELEKNTTIVYQFPGMVKPEGMSPQDYEQILFHTCNSIETSSTLKGLWRTYEGKEFDREIKYQFGQQHYQYTSRKGRTPKSDEEKLAVLIFGKTEEQILEMIANAQDKK